MAKKAPAYSDKNHALAFTAPPRPVVKWAGGKQQLLPKLLAKVPRKFNRYVEPFFGGGALFFALQPLDAVIADSNPELVNLYRVLVDQAEALTRALGSFRADEKAFYIVRSTDPSKLSPVMRAARTLYLNRTCFNGLYRVNRKGQFNVPYGKYKNPRLCDPDGLRAASAALSKAKIIAGDYKTVLRKYARAGDFVYLDPPYLPISDYSDFKRYTKEQFYEEDHAELAEEVRRLHKLGCHVILTNSNHPVVHDFYSGFDIEVIKTRRNINKIGSKRTGEDVIVNIPPQQRLLLQSVQEPLPEQVAKFPETRFMGSKQNLLPSIWQVASWFKAESVMDLFSGSGIVGYMFKAQGKQVFSNDYMAFSATFAKALIENNTVTLSKDDVDFLCSGRVKSDGFVSRTFAGLYFTDAENAFIDRVRANIKRLNNEYKRALAISTLVRACLKKRPRGIFTYTGQRYDDGRRDLQISLENHFRAAAKKFNDAVFNNGKNNKAHMGDALSSRQKADLVYVDPPYYSPLSDNEYVRRYHFVEGLARDWKGIEIQWHTKTRKFKSYPTPFNSRTGAHAAFDKLFRKHRNSVIVVSYSSNSLPTKDEIIALLAQYKNQVEVVAVNHRYSFGNQGHKVGDNNNKVQEYLFVGY